MLDKKSILLVGSYENSLSTLSTILTDLGYEVFTATDGINALKKLKETDCNLIIADMEMDNMDGMWLLKQVKRANPNTEVIMVSNHDETDVYLEAMNLGAFESLTKPIDVTDLKTTVNYALLGQQPHQKSQPSLKRGSYD